MLVQLARFGQQLVNLLPLTSQPSSPAALVGSSSWAIAQAEAIIYVNGPGSICVKKAALPVSSCFRCGQMAP